MSPSRGRGAAAGCGPPARPLPFALPACRRSQLWPRGQPARGVPAGLCPVLGLAVPAQRRLPPCLELHPPGGRCLCVPGAWPLRLSPSSSLWVGLVVALIRFMPYLLWEHTGGRQGFRPSARSLLKRSLLSCWYARYEDARNFACDGWGCPCMVVCETLVGRVGCRRRGCGDAE